MQNELDKTNRLIKSENPKPNRTKHDNKTSIELKSNFSLNLEVSLYYMIKELLLCVKRVLLIFF